MVTSNEAIVTLIKDQPSTIFVRQWCMHVIFFNCLKPRVKFIGMIQSVLAFLSMVCFQNDP